MIVEICKLQALTFQVDAVEEKLVDINYFYSALTYYAKQYVSQFEKLKLPFITEELLGKLWELTDRDIEVRRDFMKTCMSFNLLCNNTIIFSGCPSCSYP